MILLLFSICTYKSKDTGKTIWHATKSCIIFRIPKQYIYLLNILLTDFDRHYYPQLLDEHANMYIVHCFSLMNFIIKYYNNSCHTLKIRSHVNSYKWSLHKLYDLRINKCFSMSFIILFLYSLIYEIDKYLLCSETLYKKKMFFFSEGIR